MDLTANKLLIVDNEPMARRYVRQIATKLDYSVEETSTVSDALACVKNFGPGIIILDISLPDKDGIDFFTELAKIDCRATILVLSSLDRTMLETAATIGVELGLDVQGVMTKPVFPPELTNWLKAVRIDQPLVSEQMIRTALDNDEFLLHFQPTFHRAGDHPWRAVGVVGYTRWKHPDFGILLPGQFLATVEGAGLLVELTDRMILEAMQHVRYWQDRGISLSVGVHVPWKLITDSGIPERLETLTREIDIHPNKVALHISDIVENDNFSVGREVLTRLRLKEFQISYDGFSDLRSSIRYLVKLPFTAVNLDASLASLASIDNKAANSIAAIIAVARELDIEVIANGVADQLELDTLESLGCNLVRGYLFTRALPGSQIEGFVRTWNKAAIRPRIELALTGTARA